MCHPDKGKGGLCSEWSKRELTLPSAVLSSHRTAASFGMDDAMSGETTMVEGTGSTAACVVKIPLVCSLRDIVVRSK